MEGRSQKHLALILARELASQLATPTFIADAVGDLVFYNEPAGEILGRTFAEAGPMPAESWSSLFSVEDLDGAPMPLERMPAARSPSVDPRTAAFGSPVSMAAGG